MPPETNREPILTPGQRQWLLLFAVGVLSALLGKYGLNAPVPPLPAEVLTQIAETHAAAKRTEANSAAALRAAGLPVQ